MKTSTIAPLALAAVASAQRPSDVSICDYYTTALLKNNTAANQQTVLTLVVNAAGAGNYTQPNVGIAFPGFLAPGTGKYAGVNLAQYFTGALNSTNRGGDHGVSVNFFDGGGAAPIIQSKPANDTTSNQYKLLTHLYSYFGYLLGCSEFSNTTLPYTGSTNMYEVHKFMALDVNELGWFIQNVGQSAASYGVSTDDVTIVGNALNNAFGYRCSAPASIPASAPAAPQAICIDANCPLAPNATCQDYQPVIEPSPIATSSSVAGSNSTTTKPTGTGAPSSGPVKPTSSVQPYTGSAATLGFSAAGAAVAGLVAFLL